ncbi:ABC transporter substrate-binding protein [Herbaspirillum autotrophicum]|uniref:ABC transporter substrate-binding protein n=1 Tax=Herbaspirillum autotrophicum TaxID=180195 RepID=UPI00067BE9A8|nr:ABC transporter substrate-binding protein [Herbaspirillum autotrophicum]
MRLRATCLSGLMLAAVAIGARAETVNVGVTVPTTGPAAILGIGARNSVALFPKKIAGYDVNFKVVDDASDTTNSVKNAKMFLDEKVDLIVGSSTSPQSLAIIEAIAGTETPLIALGASARIVTPMDDKKKWVFKTAANDSLMASAIVKHMVDHGVKTVGFIGFSDAYGESWLTEIKAFAEQNKIKLAGVERFNPKDTSVTAQVLRVTASQPDAIIVAGSGTPAAMPQVALKERGYKGKIYQTHGAATEDFLRVGGKALNGGYLPVGPNLVWEQLPDNYATKAVSAKFVPLYESKYGKNSRSNFAAQAYDVLLLLERALPEAGKKAKPGTREFRIALRDALENIKNLPGNAGVFNMTTADHSGLDERARVIVRVEDGKWVLDSAPK